MSLIGLAHLTLLQLSPPELVGVAAAAGYDFVGLRVHPATAGERQYVMTPGSPMSEETRLRLADTGVIVLDIEFLPLRPGVGRSTWLPVLEAGAALGAQTVTVAGVDPDTARLTDTLAELTVDAREFGVRPALEPISYQAIDTVGRAATVAAASGAGIVLDALHVQRGASPITDIERLPPGTVTSVQLCDGPLEKPEHLELPPELPMNMNVDGSLLLVEARLQRHAVGEGEFPLRTLLRAVPAGTPVSIEAPNAMVQARTTPLEFAELNFRAAADYVNRTAARG